VVSTQTVAVTGIDWHVVAAYVGEPPSNLGATWNSELTRRNVEIGRALSCGYRVVERERVGAVDAGRSSLATPDFPIFRGAGVMVLSPRHAFAINNCIDRLCLKGTGRWG
jgi:hypothetical protein